MNKEYMLFFGEYVDGTPYGISLGNSRYLDVIEELYNKNLKRLRKKKYVNYHLDIYERNLGDWVNLDKQNIMDFK